MEAIQLMADICQIGTGVWFAHHIHLLAHYYQRHEQLPPELWGALRSSTSHLYDHDVQALAHTWLAQQ